ncbi:site-specific integrase [Methylobacterium sp. J-077]|uniref:site-specific integrase n=1 Tax=Methylobacterium sp. J-077 TaxID=2836656 RepID=UPI001FBB5896|nr:site-specific integrase [Methylobacterium sp. J-077]MCJ2126652.1 site-specific integrase [Methylobacterium sp. J-077]
MRSMVGLVQRRGIFYYRRTIPEALRPDMPFVLASAAPGVFSEAAPVTLKGSRAGREFWVSLGTRDADLARESARHLDREADALISLTRRRLAVHTKPKISHLDELTIKSLVATFRHRKLANDESRRRGTQPLSQAEFTALGREIEAREAELREANARGDCGATHFDLAAMTTVFEAGLHLEFGSQADRGVHLAFVEAELDLMTIIKDRQNGATRPTPSFIPTETIPTTQDFATTPPTQKPDAPTVETILEGWSRDHQPVEKTVYTFSSKVERWASFLAERGGSFQTATLSDASDWKLASLATRSAKSVSNDIYAVKAIYSWAVANGKCPTNPFIGLKQPRAVVKGQRRSTKREFTEEETACVLLAARGREGYRRWAPWIACFTGARISEICQLERSDIKKYENIHYFNMTTEVDSDDYISSADRNVKNVKKNLKTSGSKRKIPIHPKLIEEGFLEFVSACRGRYLFEDATPDRFGSRGGNATKVLSRWVRKNLKIIDQRISPNHSFRHRFSTLCKNHNVSPEMRDRLMGHSSGDTSEIYGEGYSVSTLFQEICKIPTPPGIE